MAKILIVEDEEQIGRGVSFNLRAEGHDCQWIDNGDDALAILSEEPGAFDLVLLDVMMEGMDGVELCRNLRENGDFIPILMLTAKDRVSDRVIGLEAGADDYLTKPFALEELLARVNTLLRRIDWEKEGPRRWESDETLRFGNNRVNFRTHDAIGRDGPTRLTAMEIEVLRYLSARPGEVVSRRLLLQDVWGISPKVTTRTVDNFMVRLRRMFEDSPKKPVYFKSVRGVGYRFLPKGEDG